MKYIQVPDYVADRFNMPLGHPSINANAVSKSIDRVYELIDRALVGIENPNWIVGATNYGSKADVEPYGFEWIGDKFFIYVSERGCKDAIAIFKNSHVAAEYFVWLVSGGSRSIDWSLLPEMEP